MKFRAEIRDFLKRELPPGWLGFGVGDVPESEEDWAIHKAMAPKLAGKGWLTMGWPREYGGQERSFIDQAIFREEMSYRGAPGLDVFGVCMLAPTLMCFTGLTSKRRSTLKVLVKGRYSGVRALPSQGRGRIWPRSSFVS